jgi:hypothetical protein
MDSPKANNIKVLQLTTKETHNYLCMQQKW